MRRRALARKRAKAGELDSPVDYDNRRAVKKSRKQAVKTLFVIVTLAFM